MTVAAEQVRAVRYDDGAVVLIDQRRLPGRLTYVRLGTPDLVAAAIRDLVVRGAPAIGLAAAYGVVLAGAGADAAGQTGARWRQEVRRAATVLASARPTAVNLRVAVERMLGVVARGGGTPDLLSEAERMWAAEVESNARLGERGGALLGPGSRLLTHCNAGALASAGSGTALSVVRWAWAHGRLSRVWATETRPLFQGSRLTAWELEREGIPVTVIVDSCAPWLMHCGEVDAVVVGADRVAANGDTANKIGTYGLALAARRHGLPFYVAAPTATLDPGTPSGDEVTIEERDGAEVSACWGRRLTPAGAAVWNPAFDVTPAELVTAIVTERGVARAPFLRSIAALLGKAPA